MSVTKVIDDVDVAIVEGLDAYPRVSFLELSRKVGVARNTVYSRLERMSNNGVISSFGPVIDVEALGYSVTAFTTISVAQGRFAEVIHHLEVLPNVLEVYTVAGQGDLFCRIVARTNSDLMETIEVILGVDGVERTDSVIALARPVSYRTGPLLAHSVE